MSETMTMTRERKPLNGVDVPTLFATLDAVDGQRELAKFQFRATNRWISGTHSRNTVESFYGAGGEHKHVREYTVDADHVEVLVGSDKGFVPVEMLLTGLASCLTAGIGNIAAARGVQLTEVTSKIEGDIDLQGILGLSDDVRNGFENIRIEFTIKGDAPAEKLEAIVMQSKARSAVFETLTNGVAIQVDVKAG